MVMVDRLAFVRSLFVGVRSGSPPLLLRQFPAFPTPSARTYKTLLGLVTYTSSISPEWKKKKKRIPIPLLSREAWSPEWMFSTRSSKALQLATTPKSTSYIFRKSLALWVVDVVWCLHYIRWCEDEENSNTISTALRYRALPTRRSKKMGSRYDLW